MRERFELPHKESLCFNHYNYQKDENLKRLNFLPGFSARRESNFLRVLVLLHRFPQLVVPAAIKMGENAGIFWMLTFSCACTQQVASMSLHTHACTYTLMYTLPEIPHSHS